MTVSLKKYLALISLLFISSQLLCQNVGINSDGATPAASAMLDIVATDKGLLIPRVALTATNAAGPVTSPATSLLVYNTATAGVSPNNVVPGYYYWSGSAWVPLLSATSILNDWKTVGNSGTTAGTNFIGTTDNIDLVIKTNNTERGRITGSGNVGIGTSTFNGTNPEKLVVDAGTTSSVNAIVGKGSINSYLQLNIQNQSAGNSASSDVVATADNGSETTNYVDMGINSSTYSGGIMGGVNDAYLYNIGQNLLIGTGSTSKSLVLMTGGTTQSTNERMRIDGNGNVGIGNNAPSLKLDVNGVIGTGRASTTNGSLVFSNSSNANAVTINSGVTSSSYSLSLPTAQGAASTVLTNNGSGVLSWSTIGSSSAWAVLGNSGTSPASNFIGTTDNQALSFRVNNVAAGKIETSTTANTALGYQSNLNNTGTANTSFGSQALQANTSGINNTAFGASSLKANVTGTANTGIGTSALFASTGNSNTAVGSFAMQSNVGGSNNAALGYSALSGNVSGTGNTAVGAAALQNNTAGINNTAIGNGSFQVSTGGSSNTSVGAFSLQNNNLGGSNSGFGYGALSGTVAGNNNTGLGYQAGATNTSGGNNTFIGYQADATLNNLTNATAVGYNAKVASSNSLILGGTGANAVNVGIGNNAFNGTYPEKLLIDAGTTSSVNVLVGKGTINNYLQLNIQNLSAGTNSSSDVVATADNGSETTNYVDMGINGSGNTSGIMGGADDAYLYNIGQNFLVGTGTPAKSLVFMTGGTTQSTNERMRIDGTGNVGIGNTVPSLKLDVNGVIGTGKASTTNGSLVFSNSSNANTVTINSAVTSSTYSLSLPTAQGAASTVLTNNGSGVLSWTTGPSGSWALLGNSGINTASNFIGTTDDKQLIFKSFGNSFVELGNRGTLGLTQGFTDYDNATEKVTHIRSALQFEAANASFYKPKMWADTDGNFRVKGSSAGTDYFEFGSTGTANSGGFEFIIGDDGDEPILFKSYHYINGMSEIMRLQSGRMAVGSNSFDGTNPEKLLIDAGATTSYNLMTGKGSIDNYLQINVKNSSATGSASSDLVATSNNGDETSNYIDVGINSGSYTNTTYPVLGGANTAYLYSTGNDLVIGNATATRPIRFFTGGTANANERMRIDGTGKVGIGLTSPAEVLDVTGNFKLTGAFMPSGSAGTSGYLLTSAGAGTSPTWSNPSTALSSYSWALDGNSLASIKNFGTTSNHALPFITNNTEKMRLFAAGGLAVGATALDGTNPEKLLVSSGTTTSVNSIVGRGTINSYLQLNIQNQSAGTGASSDVVATADNGNETTNYVDLGINSSGNTSGAMGGPDDAYLYNVGQNLLIGTGTTTKSLVFMTGGTTQSTNERMRIDGTGNVGIGTSTFNGTNPEQLVVDAGTTTSVNAIVGKGSIDSYLQLNIQNQSTGTSSSSDVVATANNGSEITNYIDMGINGQNYSGGVMGAANDAYLYNIGQNLLIGTGTAAKSLVFMTGGTSQGTNERMRIDGTGNVGVGTTTANSTLDVNGSIGHSITTTSTNLTLGATHYTVIITGSTPTITLPAAAAGNARRIHVIVNQTGTARNIGTSTYKDFAGGNASTVAANSSITIQSDGSNWYRIH